MGITKRPASNSSQPRLTARIITGKATRSQENDSQGDSKNRGTTCKVGMQAWGKAR